MRNPLMRKKTPPYPVVESSVVIDGVKVTYRCPETVEYSREENRDQYFVTPNGYKISKSSSVIFQPLEQKRLFRFDLIGGRLSHYSKLSAGSEDIIMGLPGSLPVPPSDPVASYKELNRLYSLEAGEEKMVPVRFDEPGMARDSAQKDIKTFLSCISYGPEGEQMVPPLGSRSVEELSSSRGFFGLYPTNDRAPGEWAQGFELCNEIRIVYTD